ncbi:MAG: branched-chain amino acid ABC transporter permease [Candidatus Eremiobacteraeota bacterium]|nr:branched-chain amino acid ABC transporter permease [Candidatus Eremiobacteraeota bacterium]MBV8356141.1 branched-chain amino acid ABC transporter permease [Candidatus Eremiobacteraeota bacterium]
MASAFYLQNILGGLAYGSLLFLIAAGLTLVFGLMRIINLAQTAFYLLGAYLGLTLILHHVDFWLASILAGVVVMALGLAVYSLFLHRYHADPLTSLLLTLGFTLMLDDAVLAIWGGDPRSIAPPPALAGSLELGALVFPAYWLAVIVFSIAIAAVLLFSLQRTMLGTIIRACVDDEEMARGLGVDVDRAFYVVFALGALLAGAAGLLGGPITSAYPGLDGELLPLAFAVVIVGGMGSLTGALVGGLVIGLVNAFGKAMFPEFSYFTIFVPVALIMALRPQGLFGRKL